MRSFYWFTSPPRNDQDVINCADRHGDRIPASVRAVRQIQGCAFRITLPASQAASELRSQDPRSSHGHQTARPELYRLVTMVGEVVEHGLAGSRTAISEIETPSTSAADGCQPNPPRSAPASSPARLPGSVRGSLSEFSCRSMVSIQFPRTHGPSARATRGAPKVHTMTDWCGCAYQQHGLGVGRHGEASLHGVPHVWPPGCIKAPLSLQHARQSRNARTYPGGRDAFATRRSAGSARCSRMNRQHRPPV
jgi:hypothetical protein